VVENGSIKLRLGGHLKASEGLGFVVSTARGMEFNHVQIMLGAGTDYEPTEINDETIDEYKKMAFGITTTVHLPYVINPCEDAARRQGYYKRSMKKYLEAATAIGATYAVLHPGFKKELTEKQAYDNLVKFLDDCWSPDYRIQLLLETDAGSKNGSAIGSAEFIQEVLRNTQIPGLGMCIDTEHLYARGVNLWNNAIRDEFLQTYSTYIKLVHLNVPDKEVSLGSFLDRHNTPFIDRKDLASPPMIKAFARWPMILERRSIVAQQQDSLFIREVLGQPLERQRA